MALIDLRGIEWYKMKCTMTATRTLGVSEARRLLPQIVERIAEAGGRVDITRRGQVTVSIVRTADLKGRTRSAVAAQDDSYPPAALRMELLVEADALDDAIRSGRANLWNVSGEHQQVASASEGGRSNKRPRTKRAT